MPARVGLLACALCLDGVVCCGVDLQAAFWLGLPARTVPARQTFLTLKKEISCNGMNGRELSLTVKTKFAFSR